ncbi:hypothetical protein B566_EDAN002832 [Ephemera danica]|nr:hypothetical protein B566_EDAN002832 [Ephemera danica]
MSMNSKDCTAASKPVEPHYSIIGSSKTLHHRLASQFPGFAWTAAANWRPVFIIYRHWLCCVAMLCCFQTDSADSRPGELDCDMKRAKETASKSSRVAGAEAADAAAAVETAAPACSSATRVATIAATMPTGLATASAVKMAGYLDKRGKRSEYLHQLSPCRGSLNLGLVNGVKPTGSSRATCPQLVISTRSQAMILRAKDRATQERWLQALLDALQLNVSTDGRNSGGNHFRYSSASLPQVQPGQQGDKETNVAENSVEQATSDLCIPKPVLRSGHTSQKDMIKELRVVGKTSLRHIDNAKSNNSPVGKRKNEIVAQLPTSTAVSKLLEKRLEESQATEEEKHVTTIILDNSRDDNQDLAVNTESDTEEIKMKEVNHSNEEKSESTVIKNKANENDIVSELVAKEQVDNKSEKISEKDSNPVESTKRKSSEAITEQNTIEKEKKVTRKKSFLGRILERKSKDAIQVIDKTISLPINNEIHDSQTRNETDEIEIPKEELKCGANELDPVIDPCISVDIKLNEKEGDKVLDSSETGTTLKDASSLDKNNGVEEVLVRNSKRINNTNKSSATTLHIYSKNRDSSKYRSVDELDILLHQLTNLTFSPLHNCVSMNDLQPLRKSRPGSEPDYDIPRPHNIFVTCSNQGIDDKESTLIHSTSFFGNSESYKSQKRLSEYLLELNRMSQIADKRSSRAVTAQNKWLKMSQQQTPMFSNDEFEVVSEEACSISKDKPSEKANTNFDLEEADMTEEMKTENNAQCEEIEINSEHGNLIAPPVVDFNEIDSSISMTSESEGISNSHVMDVPKKSNEEISFLEDKLPQNIDTENINLTQTVEITNTVEDNVTVKLEICQNNEDVSMIISDLGGDGNGIQSGIDQNNSRGNQTNQDVEPNKSTVQQETDRVMNDEQNKDLYEFAEKIIESTIEETDGNCISETVHVSLNDTSDLSSQISIPTTETCMDTEKCCNTTPPSNIIDEIQDVNISGVLLNVINVATECAIICNEENLIEDELYDTLQTEGNCSQKKTSTPENQNETDGEISFHSEEKLTNGNLLIAGDVGNEEYTLRERKGESNAAARLSFAFADSELVLQETVNNLKCEVDAESLLSLTP